MSRKIALAGVIFLSTPVWADWSWHEAVTPHFLVSHEMTWMPNGFLISLEKMHSRLRMDLAMFSPWMSKERLKLFLYKNKESYVSGQFKPPEWSAGIALYESRTVAVHDQPDKRKLMEFISHETTHLLFESYWGEVGKRPPSWLNEGLAMLEEAASPDHPERSDRYSSMIALAEKDKAIMPMEEFVKISPTKDLGDQNVGDWYAQAYSVVYYLFRTHSKLQFENFCGKLRDGKDLKESLWLVYRYQSVDQFQGAWLAWLRDPKRRSRLRPPSAFEDTDSSFQNQAPIGQIKGFPPLRP